eukprot:2361220-Rhodomonas_salina.2
MRFRAFGFGLFGTAPSMPRHQRRKSAVLVQLVPRLVSRFALSPRSIRCVSTGERVAAYAVPVPGIAQHATPPVPTTA